MIHQYQLSKIIVNIPRKDLYYLLHLQMPIFKFKIIMKSYGKYGTPNILWKDIVVGNFCSIAANVEIYNLINST